MKRNQSNISLVRQAVEANLTANTLTRFVSTMLYEENVAFIRVVRFLGGKSSL